MQNLLWLAMVLLFSSCTKHEDKIIDKNITKQKEDNTQRVDDLKLEYKNINSVEYLEHYIEDVIINGSNKLKFKSFAMQKGFADISDSKKISHYVVTLSGKKCSDHEMAKKAQMYYTSNCGGCHGNDGKGLHGAYPDLTREKLLGIEQREEFLKLEINKLEHK